MRRVLVVLEGGPGTPSASVRAEQYRNLWTRYGYEATYNTRRSKWTSRLLSAGRAPYYELPLYLTRPFLRAADAGLTALSEKGILERARECEFVYAHLVPSLDLIERIIALRRPKVVVDLVDALWLPAYRRWGWADLERIVTIADAVTCENNFTAEYYRRFNPNVFVVPDSPQLELFDAWRNLIQRDTNRVTLGWIGSASTAGSLYAIWEPLERLWRERANLHLRILGAEEWQLPKFEKVEWSVQTRYDQMRMVQEVLQMDIGLYPLFRVDDSCGRGLTKATIYMSGSAVAVCQNLGDLPRLIEDGRNGLLAGSTEEWFEKLLWLVEHTDRRKEIAAEGLRTVRERFSVQNCFEQLLGVFDPLANA